MMKFAVRGKIWVQTSKMTRGATRNDTTPLLNPALIDDVACVGSKNLLHLTAEGLRVRRDVRVQRCQLRCLMARNRAAMVKPVTCYFRRFMLRSPRRRSETHPFGKHGLMRTSNSLCRLSDAPLDEGPGRHLDGRGAHRLRARQLVRCDLDCRGTRLHTDVNGTQLIRAPLLARVLVHSLSSDSSMRRFFARPSGVSLEATGLSLPRPEVLIRSAGTPAFTSRLLSASARSSDSHLSATGSPD